MDYEIAKVGEKTRTQKSTDEIIGEFIDYQIDAKNERVKVLHTRENDPKNYFYRGYIKFFRNLKTFTKNQNYFKDIENLSSNLSCKLAVAREYGNEQKISYYEGCLSAYEEFEKFYRHPKYPVFESLE